MSANVVQLQRLFRHNSDWSPRELAEFYRVESALIQAGLKIDTERGLSDEGDPWFAFCRPDDGEVIVHIARTGGVYILAGPSYDGIAIGGDIAALVRDLVSRHPLIQMRGNNQRQRSKIFLHPAALLIAVVATAFFKSTEARALADDHKSGTYDHRSGDTRGGAIAIRSEPVSVLESHKTIVMDAAQSAVILSAVAAVLQAPESDVAIVAASTSDLLDFRALAGPAPHSPSALPASATNVEAHQIMIHEHVNVQPLGSLLLDATSAPIAAAGALSAVAHPAIAESLSLVAVLWDLTADGSVTETVSSDKPTSPASTESSPAAVATQSPLVTFRLALANHADEGLPVVQAAKITYSDGHGAVETHTVSQPSQLPTALVSALKEATHTAVEIQPAALLNSSFANMLILSLTEQTAEKAPAATVSTSVPESQSSSATASITPASQTATTDAPSNVSKTPAQQAPELSAAVQEFFNKTASWKMVNDGKAVVVYDTGALTSYHPSELKSVTFDFSDGSTLSLVGLPAALPHFLEV